jgi:hypothetical protein
MKPPLPFYQMVRPRFSAKIKITNLHEHTLMIRTFAHLDSNIHERSTLRNLPVDTGSARCWGTSKVDDKVTYGAEAVDSIS